MCLPGQSLTLFFSFTSIRLCGAPWSLRQVFLRNSVFEPLEAALRQILQERVVMIQAHYRGYRARRGTCACLSLSACATAPAAALFSCLPAVRRCVRVWRLTAKGSSDGAQSTRRHSLPSCAFRQPCARQHSDGSTYPPPLPKTQMPGGEGHTYK